MHEREGEVLQPIGPEQENLFTWSYSYPFIVFLLLTSVLLRRACKRLPRLTELNPCLRSPQDTSCVQ